MGLIEEKAALRTRDVERPTWDVIEEWRIDPTTDAMDMPLTDLNPAHPARFVAGTELPVFDRLRREQPVHFSENSQFGPYWSITRFRDIMELERRHDVFSSLWRWGGITLGGMAKEETDPFFHLPSFISQDTPIHETQRRVVQPRFSPRNLQQMEGMIRRRAGELLDDLPIDEEFDLVENVSVELTGQVLATLFDLPQDDRRKLIHWSNVIQDAANPKIYPTVRDGFIELWKCHDYFQGVWEERQRSGQRGEDLLSLMMQDESMRDLPANEFLGNLILLIVGGNDTTRNSITGSVLALNQFPNEYEKLKQDQSLIPGMVSEAIRWQSPIAHMARTALATYELDGQCIEEGDRVALWYISGNRDDGEIEDPYEFKIDRSNPRHHIAFGFGVHRCLGNRLGEMQLRVVWEEMFKRFKHIEVTGDPVRPMTSFIRGIRKLPVRVHA